MTKGYRAPDVSSAEVWNFWSKISLRARGRCAPHLGSSDPVSCSPLRLSCNTPPQGCLPRPPEWRSLEVSSCDPCTAYLLTLWPLAFAFCPCPGPPRDLQAGRAHTCPSRPSPALTGSRCSVVTRGMNKSWAKKKKKRGILPLSPPLWACQALCLL